MESIKRFIQQPYLFLVIVLLGSGLKFYQLDYKLFWEDEIATIIHTSGIHMSDHSILQLNQIKNIAYFDSLLHNNSQPYSITDQLYGLATDVHLTPGHYAFLIFWEHLIGDDPLDYRLFSVFIFLVTLPILFLLMRELFLSDLAGWIAISLFAVSPFIHIYAQEARYYILWVFIFVISNWLFLKTINDRHWKWGLTYAISLLISLYVSVISSLFILGHLVYVLFFNRDLLNKFVIQWAIVLLLYMPWIYSMYLHQQQIMDSLSWQIVDYPNFGFIPLLMGLFSDLNGR